MSEVCVSKELFWREFKPAVADSLSDDQRRELDRALAAASVPQQKAANEEISDVRLSLKWYFVRIAWGPEKRSADRIRQEQETYPAMARRNLPMLASIFAGSMFVWYAALVVSTLLFAYLIA